jgi:hypothetical protein
MSHSFTPYNTLENAFRSWWVIVVLMLLGALLGFVLNQARPPLYEAHAAIAISIDFTRSSDLEDYEEDYVIGIAGAVIASSQVREAVAAQMGLPPAELADRVSFERSYAVWTIRARDPSPQRAAELANLWADQAYQALGDSLEQAMLASRYAGQFDQLERCLEPAPPALCRDLGQLQDHIESIASLEREARLHSQGILPYTLFTLSERAVVPARPAVFDQGLMVLSGALIGLLLGVWGAHLGLPLRLLERSPRAE